MLHDHGSILVCDTEMYDGKKKVSKEGQENETGTETMVHKLNIVTDQTKILKVCGASNK